MTSKKFSISILLALLFFSLINISCGSTKVPEPRESTGQESQFEIQSQVQAELSLIFAGDIMAHAPNFKNTDFPRIWRDIKSLVSSGDLAFANVEAPVADNLPWSTYPQFNMHSEYVEEAIKAGFNVFSLANNHTNDQYLQGINETKKYFDGRKGVWACGLKDKSQGPLSYKIIEKNGFKILFVAITEILNRRDFASYIDYYPSNEEKRKELVEELKKLQNQAACDLFIFSIHSDEAEYVQKVSQGRKNFYKKLI
ncbi:MAG: CapA family protein, partial [Treponema sp.]|nr:CapA family protein [Treponema sp.]